MIKTKDIKQGVTIKAKPGKVYEALMDAKKHAKFTGEPAKISRKIGSRFTAYGKYINGKILELVKGKKIVQLWRSSDWPKRYFSTVTFLFKPAKNGTKLMFSQKGIPSRKVKSMVGGWKMYYWKPLKKFLELRTTD